MTTPARHSVVRWLRRELPADGTPWQHLAVAGITVAQYAIDNARRRAPEPAVHTDVREWLGRVQRDGYCCVPSFYDRETCMRAAAELERVFTAHPGFVQRKSDARLFGVEAASPLLGLFGRDPRLLALAGAVLRAPTVNAFTLGARLDYSPGNVGSGEGWHRDSFVVQFKALLYLSDVDDSSGPFQLIADSEKLPRLTRDIMRGRLGLLQNRVRDDQVQRLLHTRPDRLRTFCAAAGTLLLINTSAVHRGKPIARGVRHSLTNYYVEAHRAGAAMDAHFAPVLRHDARSGEFPI